MSTQSVLPGGTSGCDASEVRQGKIKIEIKAQLSQLNREFAGQTKIADSRQHVQVVLRHAFGFGGVRDVFSEMAQDGAQAALLEPLSGCERILRIFSRHETLDRAAREPVAWSALAQPRALRCFQEYAAYQAHVRIVELLRRG